MADAIGIRHSMLEWEFLAGRNCFRLIRDLGRFIRAYFPMDSILSTSIICPSQFCRPVYYISAYCDAQPEASGDNRDYEACIIEVPIN